MHVNDLGKLCCNSLETLFQSGIGNFLFARLDRRGLTLNMRQDRDHFRNFRANLRLQLRYAIVSFLELKVFVQFEVLLHMQLPIQILYAYVMHVHVMPRGHCADAVENAFIHLGPRQGVDHHVRIGQ